MGDGDSGADGAAGAGDEGKAGGEEGGGRDDLIPVKSNEVILPDSYSLS